MVTGASEGIGRAFARALAERGYAVTLVARREAALAEVLRQMNGEGHGLLAADLSTADGLAATRARLADRHVHLLVNNAGVGAFGPFGALPLETHLEVCRLNMQALVALSHAFCQQAQPEDALVNVSSILGFAPQPSQPIYAATKAFVTSLTESLWLEQKARGVHVMGLHPGATSTRFGEHAGRPMGFRRPVWMSQSPEQVVDVALRALDRKKGPSVACGLVGRIFVTGARWLPRSWLVRLMRAAG